MRSKVFPNPDTQMSPMEKCLCAETTTAKVRSQEQQENAINQRQADFNAWVDDTESGF
jgi:hypothetical protein